ncbi:uncharacterized protein SCHCODRAFT_02224212 [Schizophyllum commune H4-8]|uniref:uncharacterized protein n=1 Tax=Schizophyllum commune (strain H4-8 / FGSC 9210) TaxID=578458 RepID=UPI00215E012B|nr:uncharacterized protein SCHCODRAFT_02224212 [Schizophyllum commune H4-8]KAI5895126.1 hypothetical protein SCHCODRAFT_02224212 [Schizophyllum commune H4-8]
MCSYCFPVSVRSRCYVCCIFAILYCHLAFVRFRSSLSTQSPSECLPLYSPNEDIRPACSAMARRARFQ